MAELLVLVVANETTYPIITLNFGRLAVGRLPNVSSTGQGNWFPMIMSDLLFRLAEFGHQESLGGELGVATSLSPSLAESETVLLLSQIR